MVPRPAPSAATAAVGGFDTTSDEIDDEIREVFLEEFEEKSATSTSSLPPRRAAPEDLDGETAPDPARVPHAQGSGRLVGAKALGEFSWKIEGMLNRVLDASRPASPAVVAMVDQAFYAAATACGAAREGGISADLAGMEAVADRIAIGEDAYYDAHATAAGTGAGGTGGRGNRHRRAGTRPSRNRSTRAFPRTWTRCCSKSSTPKSWATSPRSRTGCRARATGRRPATRCCAPCTP